MIGAESGTRHIRVASIYGYDGASHDEQRYQLNEKRITMAIIRMLTKGELPYFLCGDFNVKPEASEAIQRALDKGVLIDVPAEQGYRNQPTFIRDGILEEGPIEAGPELAPY